MMTITIALFGDYWLNSQEVETKIRSVSTDTPVYLDFQAEGVSVCASGIQQKILDICADTGRSRDSVKIANNPNIYEKTLFENIGATEHERVTSLSKQSFRSHFLAGDLLRAYWRDPPKVDNDARLFGLFIGRRTIARDVILRDCLEESNKFLFSMMSDPMGIQTQIDEIELESWMPATQIEAFREWRKSIKVASIDNKSVRDQYTRFVPKPVTNSSILDFYHRFRIEIVPETYTRGDTFFPTEKTARPLSAEKPILVYGPKNFLAKLRDLYGYLTYGDHWDESYDQLEGPERWRAMQNSMKDITTATVDDRVCDIAKHNRKILEKMKEWEI